MGGNVVVASQGRLAQERPRTPSVRRTAWSFLPAVGGDTSHSLFRLPSTEAVARTLASSSTLALGLSH